MWIIFNLGGIKNKEWKPISARLGRQQYVKMLTYYLKCLTYYLKTLTKLGCIFLQFLLQDYVELYQSYKLVFQQTKLLHL